MKKVIIYKEEITFNDLNSHEVLRGRDIEWSVDSVEDTLQEIYNQFVEASKGSLSLTWVIQGGEDSLSAVYSTHDVSNKHVELLVEGLNKDCIFASADKVDVNFGYLNA